MTTTKKAMEYWTEVTDPVEIARLNKRLTNALRTGTKPGGEFRVGYPQGSFDAHVRLAPLKRDEQLWAYSGRTKKTNDFITLIGHYVPDQRGPLLIDLQFNFPNNRFNRMKGGAFVKDRNGRAFLAHRGIVTRGTSRVKKQDVFTYLEPYQPVVVDSSVRPIKIELLVVSALDDDRLIPKISAFAIAMRNAATLADLRKTLAPAPGKKIDGKRKRKTRVKTKLDVTLSEYRDEFDGTRIIKRKNQVVMKWTHGKVVSALHAALKDEGKILKCQAIDLILNRGRDYDVFEVKRSSASQSVYTAIGQLVFNSMSLERELQAKSIRKFLVLPRSTKYQARQERCKELGFDLITFEQAGDGFKFFGLPK